MAMTDKTRSTMRQLATAFADGSLSPATAAADSLEAAHRSGPDHWFISILDDLAKSAAASSEKRLREGRPLSPVDGVPVAVKDIMYIEGVKCTAGSTILADNIAPYDSFAVRRLREAGAVIVGTTNLHEFAAGSTSDNPHYGAVLNPWDKARLSGGSSGGSAAAVSAGIVPAALGTDTGGSVRIPAALCGTIGLKPTYGRVSRLGVIPLAASLDTVGVLSNSVWDAAVTLSLISGHDSSDVTTADVPVPDFVAEIKKPFGRMRVGVPRKYFHDILDPKVASNFEEFMLKLEGLGCVMVPMELDGVDDAYQLWIPIRRAEATAFHLKWLSESPEKYGEDVRALLEKGRDIPAVSYVAAVNARPGIIERFQRSMAEVDLLAVPTTCITAPKIGQRTVDISGQQVEVYSALNRLTIPFNYVGFPAVSIPSGVVSGLPVGVQLVANLFDEGKALRLAQEVETQLGFPAPAGGAA